MLQTFMHHSDHTALRTCHMDGHYLNSRYAESMSDRGICGLQVDVISEELSERSGRAPMMHFIFVTVLSSRNYKPVKPTL